MDEKERVNAKKRIGDDVANQITAPVPVAEETRTPPSPGVSQEELAQLEAVAARLPELSPVNETPVANDVAAVEKHDTLLDISVSEGSGIDDTSPAIYEAASNKVEQTLRKLNEAARRIAEEDPRQSSNRVPRASRLAPFYDVRADIQRGCPSLPQDEYSTQPEAKSILGRTGQIPDLWPWFSDDEDDESNQWMSGIDPLEARRLPGSTQQAVDADEKTIPERPRVEPASNKKAPIEQQPTRKTRRLPKMHRRWRVLLVSLAALAVLALVVDVALVWLASQKADQLNQLGNTGMPMLTVSQGTVQYGQELTIEIRNFTPNGSVSLTRDIGEPILMGNDVSLLQVNEQGMKDITIVIDSGWDPGMHSIQAEDTKMRFTANATLRVNAGPTRPPRLVLETTTLDLGPGIEGGTTVQPLQLQNGGGGSIAWTATSDQPWLTVSPTRGIFSDSVELSVGGSRLDLSPQKYTGTITIAAPGQPVQTIAVSMDVRPIPADAGAVLAVSPAVLDFSAIDGGVNPDDQYLTIRNIGNKPLYWTLQENKPVANTPTAIYQASTAQNANWLKVSPTLSTIEPQSQISVKISVDSSALLPGTYTKTLLFGAQDDHEALNSPSPVNVSLTVQRGCGVSLNVSELNFTAVIDRGTPSPQSLNIAASDSCQGTVSWQAESSASWLTLDTAQGSLDAAGNDVLTASVNTAGLRPGTYEGMISILMAQSLHTIMVKLKVQDTPLPSAPVLGAIPLSAEFSTVLGQGNTAGKQVTITNTGGSPLRWSTVVNMHAPAWLGVSPTGGTIGPDRQQQVTINVNAANLTPGTYVGQVEIHAQDENGAQVSGSPQIVAVSFVVRPPCSVSLPSTSSLRFTEADTSSAPQSVSFSVSGSCSWPLSWKAIVSPGDGSANWLGVSPTAGSIVNESQSVSLAVNFNQAALTASSARRATIDIVVNDVNGASAGNVQRITVNLVKPCSLQTSVDTLSFTTMQGQNATTPLSLFSSGSCVAPVNWNVSVNDGGSGWLAASSLSGSFSGEGYLDVSVRPGQLAPGTYTGSLTFTATDNAGGSVRQIAVPVTLGVSGFTVNGTAYACSGNSCNALSNATVTLRNANGSFNKSVTTDTAGNYSFSNVPAGSYTISVATTMSGAESPYTKAVEVTGNTTVPMNVPISTVASTATTTEQP